MAINLVLVDDHVLLRNGLADLLENKGYNILFQASNGKEFIENLVSTHLPDVVSVSYTHLDVYKRQPFWWLLVKGYT